MSSTSATTQRPIVFMDIQIGETPAGRMKFELFSDVVPKTAENFRQLCTGEYRIMKSKFETPRLQKCDVPQCTNPSVTKALMKLTSKSAAVYLTSCAKVLIRIYDLKLECWLILKSWGKGGDFLKGDGTGSFSIYGEKFPDENFVEKHTGPGLLSMANSGPNSNGCQFFVTTAKCDFLDGKHVVFGRVLDGMLTLRKIENVPTGPNNRPKLVVKITECGEM
ncbi:hypothetical protein NP233_g11859 [Leucocoprinus birnbaumii]|uniref:Peptidyl-prolyl cis-trans isomerase n=1 Tax=Leucocoprinus birnbaumii TaxID=56174 RepID=A0AAD5VG02_9AGAR|nr:hypothetical protein NP233_g11859 [Leucocoprinus birnbaumii]